MNSGIKEWWRYPLALIVFILMYFLLPSIISLILSISNIFLTAYMRNDEPIWAWFTAYIAGPSFTYETAVNIFGKNINSKNYLFISIICVIAGVWSLFVSFWNYYAGINSFPMSCCVFVGGITYFIASIESVKKYVKTSKN